MKVAIPPSSTVRNRGLIEPPVRAEAVTVKLAIFVKFAITVQSSVRRPVV